MRIHIDDEEARAVATVLASTYNIPPKYVVEALLRAIGADAFKTLIARELPATVDDGTDGVLDRCAELWPDVERVQQSIRTDLMQFASSDATEDWPNVISAALGDGQRNALDAKASTVAERRSAAGKAAVAARIRRATRAAHEKQVGRTATTRRSGPAVQARRTRENKDDRS